MIDTHLQKLQNMFLTANYNQQLFESTTCVFEEGRSTISLEISDKYFHALGAIHGSVYFKLLDDAAFFAVNSLVTDVFVLTTNFTINIIRPVSAGIITAKGSVRFKSKNLFIGEATLYNEAGKEIAFGSGHFAKSRVALTDAQGYE